MCRSWCQVLTYLSGQACPWTEARLFTPSVFPADYPHRTHCHQLIQIKPPGSAGYSDFPAYSQILQRPWAVKVVPEGDPQSPFLALLRLTVRVTAAVHRGFSLGLAPRPLTFRHWAGVSLYT